MQIGIIVGATRTIGQSQGYLGLPLRDIKINDKVNGPDTPAMETAWLPLPKELMQLQLGAPVILRVLGTGHPPVMVYVGDLPSDGAGDALPDASAVFELMKNQLLIALINRLGGVVDIPVEAVDAAGAFNMEVAVVADTVSENEGGWQRNRVVGRRFHIEVTRKAGQLPDDEADPTKPGLLKPRGNGGFVSVEVCVCALALVGDVPGFAELEPIVSALTQEQRDRAYDWAVRLHLKASDNDDVYVPPRPAFIPGKARG